MRVLGQRAGLGTKRGETKSALSTIRHEKPDGRVRLSEERHIVPPTSDYLQDDHRAPNREKMKQKELAELGVGKGF